MKNGIWIAIDGPAGSGKSTIANTLLSQLDNFVHVNTGLMYRAFAYFCIDNCSNIDSIWARHQALRKFKMSLEGDKVFIFVNENKIDITLAIQDSKIATLTSKISSYQEVREKLVALQREMAQNKNIIMDGRDIGTIVLPNADLKIYLDASIKKRAERRHLQMKNLGLSNIPSIETLEAEIAQRDYMDINRINGALKKADDAIIINTDNMTVKECVDKILNLLKDKLN